MNVLFSGLSAFFSRLRSPWLFALIAGLFVLDVLIPDFVPLIDELMLAAGTVMLSRWRKPESPPSSELPRR